MGTGFFSGDAVWNLYSGGGLHTGHSLEMVAIVYRCLAYFVVFGTIFDYMNLVLRARWVLRHLHGLTAACDYYIDTVWRFRVRYWWRSPTLMWSVPFFHVEVTSRLRWDLFDSG